MKKLIKYLFWELNNEFAASGYFVVMLSIYSIISFLFGKKEVDMLILLEMFLTNYILSTLQKLILNFEKAYSAKSVLLRTGGLCLFSFLLIIAVSYLGGWFREMPGWAGLLIYVMLIISYITVWIITVLDKKYDTKKLNRQLANYQNKPGAGSF